MFILDDGQRLYLQSRARFALIKVEENKGQKEEWRLSPIIEALHEVCGVGYSIAMGEVRSTPWEFVSVLSAPHGGLLWRRRKAVAKIAAESKEV